MEGKPASFEFVAAPHLGDGMVSPPFARDLPPKLELGNPAPPVGFICRVSMGHEYYMAMRQQIVDLTADNDRLKRDLNDEIGKSVTVASLYRENDLLREKSDLLGQRFDDLRDLVRRAAAL